MEVDAGRAAPDEIGLPLTLPLTRHLVPPLLTLDRPLLPSSSHQQSTEPERLPPELADGGGNGAVPSPEAAVRAFYEAITCRDVAALHRLLAPDLEWWFHGPPEHQHLKRLLTGEEEEEEGAAFDFEPLEVAAFGSTVVAEGCSPGSAVWVHAWTVGPDGVITQVREYFNTSLTVTRLGGDSVSPPAASPSPSKESAGAAHCVPVWQSRLHQRTRKSLPGLVLAI